MDLNSVTAIPFVVRDLPGEVTVRYGVNADPSGVGYGAWVLGDEYPPEMALGFPVIQADVDYQGQGYVAVMAWIQVVRFDTHDGVEPKTVFDVAPQITDSDVPYMSFGVRPTLFDAPGFTKPDVTWDADSFLVHTPDAVLSRIVSPICGFKWGYRMTGGVVRPLPVSVAEASDWQRNLGDLRDRYPSWTFHDSWATVG